MNPQEKKLDKLKKLIETANEDYATPEQVVELATRILEVVKEVKESLSGDISSTKEESLTEIRRHRQELESFAASIGETSSSFSAKSLESARKEISVEMELIKKLIPTLPDPVDLTELENQIAVLMEWEPESNKAEDIRNKLETLKDEERLDASAIKNLPEFVQKNSPTVVPVNHPLWALMDVSIEGITAGQSIQWDGNRWIPYTPAGSGGTPVWGENLTPQGPGASFTLAHTPIVGTVRLFRGGAYQSVANGDYTITGANITLIPALVSGEVLVCDYSY